jgi:Tetratricopeptide repeat
MWRHWCGTTNKTPEQSSVVFQGVLRSRFVTARRRWAARTVPRPRSAIQEKVLGPDHPDVALALNNFARFYNEQGRNAEAYASFRELFAKQAGYKDPSLFPVILAAQRAKLLTPELSFNAPIFWNVKVT